MKKLTKISILVLLLLFNYNLLSQVPTNGLVAYYPFNGNAIDASGNGNNGTVYGATLTTDRFGNNNQAYSFNGINNYIKGDCSLFPTAERTTSLWFYSDSFTTGRSILDYGGGDCGISWTQVINNQDNAQNTLEIQSHCRNNRLLYVYSNPPTGRWYHWAIITSPTGTKMYLDGVLVVSNATYINNTIVSGKNFAFGSGIDGTGIAPYVIPAYTDYFAGKLDDIRIYNRALNESEILALYHEGGWQQNTVTTSSNPVNAGTTSGGGVYNDGTNVLVVANPNNGYIFLNWTESGNVVSTNPSYQFIVTSNRNLVANFATKPTLLVSPLYIGVSSNSGTGTFTVTNTTGGAMNWTAVSNINWINITSGSSGTNNGTINFSYQTNFSNSRVGTITVTATDATGSPQTVDVRQDKLVSVEEETIPTKFALSQNYPNPFNPSTTIKYQVPTQSYVVIKLFNSLGQEIRTLVSEQKTQGRYELLIDGSELVSGVYFCQMRTQNFVDTKKLILMR